MKDLKRDLQVIGLVDKCAAEICGIIFQWRRELLRVHQFEFPAARPWADIQGCQNWHQIGLKYDKSETFKDQFQ